MTDLTALIHTVCANPHDTDLRRVVADAFEEAGDMARAEFIRLQIELATYPPEYAPLTNVALRLVAEKRFTAKEAAGVDPKVVERAAAFVVLHHRERKLLEKHWKNWYAPWPWCGTVWCKNLQTSATLGNDLNAIEFRRGFVEAVSCSLADWYGGACGRCKGKGDLTIFKGPGATNPGFVTCPGCHGSGTVGGHGPALVLAAPVLEVVTDRKPGDEANGSHYWEEPGVLGLRADWILPTSLFEHLNNHTSESKRDWSMATSRQKFYLTREAALVALSQALVTWARAKAGLPELKGAK